MSSEKPKLAIIGAGSRGNGYGRYVAENPDQGQVVAVAEPRDFHRNRVAERHRIAPECRFKDWRDLLSGPPMADAVVIATTDRQHTEPAVAAARKGYHILLEKPMAPSAEECRQIVAAARQNNILLTVCHVLRYAPFYTRIKEIIASGQLGGICSIQHMEGIAWWHFAHSYVRGTFGLEATSSFSLLAKSCHDLDLLRWWVDRDCRLVSSFGKLHHFRPECAPPQAAKRCLDCPLADSQCPYSATRFYFERLRSGRTGWPLAMVVEEPTEVALEEALRTGPYGKCVYYSDNDVVDNQIVNCQFEGGISAAMTMSAFTPHGRKVRIMGTHGYLEGDENIIKVLDFSTQSWTEYDINKLATDISGGHGGGDQRMMYEFLKAVGGGDRSGIITGPEISLDSHLIVFAAEKARRENRIVDMQELKH